MNDASFNTELSAEQKAHETSMDDILASIRRIIADDDALPLSRRARASAPPATARAPDPAPAAPAAEAFVSLGERLTRRSAPVELESSVAPESAPLAPRPPLLKLRRFAPGLDPAPEAADKEVSAEQVPVQSAAPPELRPSLAEVERPAGPPSASVLTLVQPSAQLVESRFKVAPLVFRAPAFTPTRDKPGNDDIKGVAPESRAEPVQTPPAAEEESEPALLSPASGAKIGASFEALAESLLLRDPKMIERLAREMLRPMLKEWLDDHLPDVVERLVRAEIERVARGGV